MGPAIQHANFIWIGLVAFLLLLTSILLTLYQKSNAGENGSIDLNWRKLNGAWWYGKLAYIWLTAQMLMYYPMIWTIVNTGWTWRIIFAVEAIVTFILMLWWMKVMAAKSAPKDKETKLLTAYTLLALFLINPLLPSSPPNFDNPLKDRGLMVPLVILAIYFAGTMYYTIKSMRATFKSMRATLELAKSGAPEPKVETP